MSGTRRPNPRPDWTLHPGGYPVDQVWPDDWRPNGPGASWIGHHPLASGSRWPYVPVPGESVYFLFDQLDKLCYIGESGLFRNRIRQHANVTPFKSWQAYRVDLGRPARSQLQIALIGFYQPYLNKVGRGFIV